MVKVLDPRLQGSAARGAFVLGIAVPLLLAAGAAANEYTPTGFYEVDRLALENGFEVVLKQRREARNVSIRLVVGLGSDDFPCGRQQTSHFLEHLLFTGTSQHDEAELKDLVERHGGDRNAYAESERTTYTIDIYSGHALLAIDVLHEILTDSLIAPEDVEITRDVIQRESGGSENPVLQWMYARGFGKSGSQKAWESLGFDCPNYETTDAISRDDILDAYERYYRPNNMTLVVVGRFDRPSLVARIRDRFGPMEPAELPERSPRAMKPRATALLTSTFSPLIGDEADVGIAVGTGGYRSPDYYPLRVLTDYLDAQLYKTIRVEKGLSYGPHASSFDLTDRGVLYASADSSPRDKKTVLDLIRQEIEQLAKHPLDEQQLEQSKRSLLLGAARGLEANANFADYYVESLYELHAHGRFLNEEDQIAKVSSADVARVARKLFLEGELVEVIDDPTFSSAGFTSLLVSLAGLPLAAAWLWWRRHRKP